MKKNLMVLAGLLMTGLLSMSIAGANDARGYLGFQLGQSDLEVEKLNYALARVGIKWPNNVAIEGRYGAGLGDETVNGAQLEIDRVLGLYGAYYFDLSESVSLYGIAGWSEIKTRSKGVGDAVIENEEGFSYGIGAEFKGFNLEWIQYLDTSDAKVDAIAIGYNYHF